MNEINFKAIDYVSLDTVLAGRVELPPGVFLNEDRSGFTIEDDVQQEVLNMFAQRVVADIPPMPDVEKSPSIGNYLVANQLSDPIFEDSIIFLTGYWPLNGFVKGEGIIKGHLTTTFSPGWELNKLYQEITGYEGEFPHSWNVLNKQELGAYIKEKDILLVPNHESLKLYDLKELNKSILN